MSVEQIDFDESDFAEIEPLGGVPKLIGPCVVTMKETRGKKPGAQIKQAMLIAIRPSLCIEDGIEPIVDAHRVTAGYSANHHALMFKALDSGAFRWRKSPVGASDVRFIKLGVPQPGLTFAAKQALADIEVRAGRLFVVIPRIFWTPVLQIAGPRESEEQPQPAMPAARPVDLAPGLMGDPSPDRSALANPPRRK